LLLGDGLLNLRLSTSIFQAMGLSFGLLTIQRLVRRKPCLVLIALLLWVWMFPRHKLFEPALTMMAVYFGMKMIDHPDSLGRYFLAGVFTGMASTFGPNHGLYVSSAFFVLILIICLKTGIGNMPRCFSAWFGGGLTGFSPMLAMILIIPGFFESIRESMTSVFRTGTNLPLPTPWPWVTLPGVISDPHITFFQALFEVTGSFAFLFMPIIFGATLMAVLFKGPGFLRSNSVLVSASVVGLFYQYHAFSRPDMGHVAQALPPAIIVAIAIPRALNIDRWKFTKLAGIAAIILGIFSGLWAHDYFHYIRHALAGNPYEQILIGKDTLLIKPDMATLVRNVGSIVHESSETGNDVFVAPHWPGFYPMLNRKSPVWETYFLFKSTDEHQRRMIARMRNLRLKLVIVGDIALDGREDLRFRNTHALVWDFIVENFHRLHSDRLPENFSLFKPLRSEKPGI
ncbi:MAG: hypothetical protein AB7V04_13145, partial [Desulfomonilaceae bacterium]